MKYYPKINGLRFVAIFLVLLEHFAPYLGRPIFAGFYGVDLFFVISGFLVTLVLLKRSDKSFGKNYLHFIGRRTLRIFPIYYLAILILLIINAPYIGDFLGSLLTYTFNYAVATKTELRMPMSPFWSLCVEEQFYLFWPLIVLSFKSKPKILLAITSIIIVIGYTQFVYSIIPSLAAYNYFSLLTRMGSLGMGALGAILMHENLLPEKLLKNKIVEYSFLVLFPIFLGTVPYRYSLPVFGVFSLYFVLKCINGFCLHFINKFLTNKKVIYLGIISYGIYVFHMPINFYFTKYLFDPVWLNINYSSLGKFRKLEWHSWIIKFPLYSFMSICVAAISFKYVETPILKLKDTFFKY